MGKGIKILLSITALLLVVGITALYFVSSKINPAVIKKYAIEAIEENLNGVKAQIKFIDYKIGTSVKFEVKDILLTQKKTRSKLLEFSKLKVEIPLIAILTSGGVVDIEAKSPKIFVMKNGDKLNWMQVLSLPEPKEKKGINPARKQGEIKLPKFVERSKLNFRLNDLDIFLNLGTHQKSKIRVEKVVVKNLNFKKSTAFEIKSAIKYQLGQDDFFQTKTQIIGEIFLKDLLGEQSLNLRSSVKIEETQVSSLPIKIPNLKGKVKVKGKEGAYDAHISFSGNGITKLDSNVLFSSSKVEVKSLKSEFDLEQLRKLFSKEILDSLTKIDLEASGFEVNGKADINLGPLSITPDFKFNTIKSIGVKIHEGISSRNSLFGSYKGTNLELKAKTEILSGNIFTELSTNFDVLKIPKNITELSPAKIKVNVDGIKASKKFLQTSLWGKNNKENSVKPKEQDERKEKIILPTVEMKITGKNIFIANEVISFAGIVDTSKETLSSENFVLRYGKGKLNTRFTLSFDTPEELSSQFKLNFKRIRLEGFNAFFPPYLSELKGNFIGEVTGNIRVAKELKYRIHADVQGTRGEMKNLNISQILGPMLSNVKYLKGKVPKKQNVSSKFQKLSTRVNMNEKLIDLKSLHVVGHDKEFNLKAKGSVSMIGGQSVVTGSVYAKEIAKDIYKLLGTRSLPFRLKGYGFAIYNPDYAYTSRKLQKLIKKKVKRNIKKELKKSKRKIIKKTKAIIKKEKAKAKKKIEDEIKNKLKGIKF